MTRNGVDASKKVEPRINPTMVPDAPTPDVVVTGILCLDGLTVADLLRFLTLQTQEDPGLLDLKVTLDGRLLVQARIEDNDLSLSTQPR